MREEVYSYVGLNDLFAAFQDHLQAALRQTVSLHQVIGLVIPFILSQCNSAKKCSRLLAMRANTGANQPVREANCNSQVLWIASPSLLVEGISDKLSDKYAYDGCLCHLQRREVSIKFRHYHFGKRHAMALIGRYGARVTSMGNKQL